MTEETERVDPAPESPGASVEPVAVALALGGASQAQADAFLKKQEAFIDDQRKIIAKQSHHLDEQFKQLRLNIWEKYLGVLLRIATAFIGVAIATAMAWLVWNAAKSNDLVIDAFAVPPDLAARGLSGPVVAAKLSDKIATMQAETLSQQPARSYSNSLAEEPKLEIPETGVSLSELDRFLREKLGHDVHIGGEMVQSDNGVVLTARVGGNSSVTVSGVEADTNALLQKLAEQVYRITQPYRYGVWAWTHGRREEGATVLRTQAMSGPNDERAADLNGLGLYAGQFESEYAALALLSRSHALDPNNIHAIGNISVGEYTLGRFQDSLRDYQVTLTALLAHGRDYSPPDQLESSEHFVRASIFMYQGALLDAADQNRKAVATEPVVPRAYAARLAVVLAALHEPGAARVALAENRIFLPDSVNAGGAQKSGLHARLVIALEAQDWPGVLAAERPLPELLAQYPGQADSRPTMFDPLVALALAHMGQFAAAESRLRPTPSDCYPCLRARGQVAALQRQDARADWWFARAVTAAPSIPYAESEWGRALLDRGKPDEAIGKFKLSNQKGPHFADPLEGWGEALMTKNQSHLALAKFVEADKYAPNWGRLHLKWGEALVYAGKKDEAKAQFARAAQLDLTRTEKAELIGIARYGGLK
jgi:tetratricopeptide (TPR) repeat protein